MSHRSENKRPENPHRPPAGPGLCWWWHPYADPGAEPWIMSVYAGPGGELLADPVWSPDGAEAFAIRGTAVAAKGGTWKRFEVPRLAGPWSPRQYPTELMAGG